MVTEELCGVKTPECGVHHDQDVNAAKMILLQGKKTTTVGTTESKARRLISRLSGVVHKVHLLDSVIENDSRKL